MTEYRYRQKLKARIRENLDNYFPGENLEIAGLKKISEEGLDEIFMKTYLCELKKGNKNRKLYIKYFSKGYVKKFEQIKYIKKFDKYRQKLKIPRIFDFFTDLNTLIMAEIPGKTLSSVLPIYLFPLLNIYYKNKIEIIIKKVAKNMAYLHKITYSGTEEIKKFPPLGKRHFNVISGEIDNFDKIKKLMKEIEKTQTISNVVHGDMKLSNILITDTDINFIDFQLVRKFYLRDLVSFLINLELLQKFPWISKKYLHNLNNIFLVEYSKHIDWKIDYKLLNKIKIIEMCKILVFLKLSPGNDTNLLKKLISRKNIKYLKNEINKQVK